ncbi:MAG: MBL fold metallo-hydrolase, partial [Pseudomonadota bacterium]
MAREKNLKVGLVLFTAVVAIGAAAAIIGLNMPAVQDRIVDGAARAAIRSDDSTWRADDGLTVIFCGTGSPLPSLQRAQTCTAVVAGDQFFLVDIGTGAWENIQLLGLPGASLGGIFLTHFHSDHFGDLGEANLDSWVDGRATKLRVYGPTGVEKVVRGINAAYALDNTYRTAHHTKAVAPPRTSGLDPIEFLTPDEEETVVYDDAGLRVTAFRVDHHPVDPSVGYRFERDGRTVVISGDTAPSKRVVTAAMGADLLVHEAQANHMVRIVGREAKSAGQARIAKIMDDIPSYHTSPVDAAKIANEANVPLLALNHLTPAPDNSITKKIFMRGVSAVRP